MTRPSRRTVAAVLASLCVLALLTWLAASPPTSTGEPEPGPRAAINQPEPERRAPQVPLGEAADGSPNLLVVMTDDMRYDDLRYMPFTRDYFDRNGVSFQNSFSPFPWCCPARASFVSGLLSQNHRVFRSTGDYGFGQFDDSRSVATALRGSGYNTAFVGRYLNGYGRAPSYVTGGNSARYVPPGWDEWRAMPKVALPLKDPLSGGPFKYFDSTLNVNGRLEPHPREYQTTLLGEQTRDVLDEYADEAPPWFLYLAPSAPHWGLPWCERDDPCGVRIADGRLLDYHTPARPRWVRGLFDEVTPHSPGMPADGSDPEPDMSDQPEWLQSAPRTREQVDMYTTTTRQRGEALYLLDLQVRRTFAQLRRSGELDDTVVVFTSDNGYLMGEHRQPPSKTKPHEPSLRVPFLIAGPGIPRGETRVDPVTTVDITATLADYAGASDAFAYPVDGTSLRGTIEDGDRGWDELVLYSGFVREVGRLVPGLADEFTDGRNGFGIRTPRWSYSRFQDGTVALYDLDADPDQLVQPGRAAARGRRRGTAAPADPGLPQLLRRPVPRPAAGEPPARPRRAAARHPAAAGGHPVLRSRGRVGADLHDRRQRRPDGQPLTAGGEHVGPAASLRACLPRWPPARVAVRRSRRCSPSSRCPCSPGSR